VSRRSPATLEWNALAVRARVNRARLKATLREINGFARKTRALDRRRDGRDMTSSPLLTRDSPVQVILPRPRGMCSGTSSVLVGWRRDDGSLHRWLATYARETQPDGWRRVDARWRHHAGGGLVHRHAGRWLRFAGRTGLGRVALHGLDVMLASARRTSTCSRDDVQVTVVPNNVSAI